MVTPRKSHSGRVGLLVVSAVVLSWYGSLAVSREAGGEGGPAQRISDGQTQLSEAIYQAVGKFGR
ncbi:hypothetical protein L13192_05091 [Pyrenophora tritici-repentis]|uniref:Uncharacterized protein n=1 Tax=Pyrenophora tritici-repentis TaxID=45151 RepID=A0A922T1R7_9PLEO|nr:hypothetical protein Ptr86124_004549 [Pyrenophora tritici-repentis]KAI1671734.1 hypothetical protein L13192_05091 [Pyrenophora tritici-repentis]KAI1685578.1 hypothetical protein KJE20_05862 [Pyrenophora tritici-repentis]